MPPGLAAPSLYAGVRVAGALLLASAAAEAQGTIRGTVHDSLSRRGPVAGAVVELVGTTRRELTDARGRFEFRDVPPGTHILRHHDVWTDSLSLPPLTATASVRDGRVARVTLSSPGRQAYQRAVCGTAFAEEAGVLRGQVRTSNGEPAPGVFVGAVWSQAVVSREGLSGEVVGSVDTTNALGVYTLCGVPRSASFVLRAGDDSVRTDMLTIGIGDAFVARRDLVIGDASRGTRVRGRVLNASGAPLTEAVVATSGDSAIGTRVQDDGRFTLSGVPMRTTEVIVRRVGFLPTYVIVEPTVDGVELADVVLQPVPYGLDTVRINAARSASELEFLERQRVGWGEFLDSTELARYPALSANVLQTLGSGIRSSGGSQPRVMLRMVGSAQSCFPTIWVDGVRFGRTVDGFEEAALLRQAKRIEIHRAPAVPFKYADALGCGVVLIWTQ